MNLVVTNKYYEILFDQTNSILVIRWKDDVHELDVNQYKKEMLKAHEYLLDLQPRFLIHDGTHAVYPPTESLQKWTLETISPIYVKVHLEKMAYVSPQEHNTLLFLKGMVTQAKDKFQRPLRKLFTNIDDAIRWLLED